MSETTWLDRAACAGMDINLFYVPDGAGGSGDPYREARKVCARCPVIAECLEEEMRNPKCHQFGFRAGLEPWRRYRLAAPGKRGSRFAPTIAATPPARHISRARF